MFRIVCSSVPPSSFVVNISRVQYEKLAPKGDNLLKVCFDESDVNTKTCQISHDSFGTGLQAGFSCI